MDATYDLGLPRCIFGFFVGCLVYRARAAAPAAPLSRPIVAELAALIAIIWYVTIANRSAVSFAAPLVFAAAVYIFSFEAGPISRLLQRPAFQSLGRWSYSIYMLQALLVFVIGLAVSALERRLGIPLWKNIVEDGIEMRVIASDHKLVLDLVHLAYAGSVVGLAAITYRLIEEPGRRYFQRLADNVGTPGFGQFAALVGGHATHAVRLPKAGKPIGSGRLIDSPLHDSENSPPHDSDDPARSAPALFRRQCASELP
jgi:peptidoglycan/LPS O-acetylase OafA/YrhL